MQIKYKIELQTSKTEFKSGYHLELSTREAMKLFGSTKNKMTSDKMVKMYHILRLQK